VTVTALRKMEIETWQSGVRRPTRESLECVAKQDATAVVPRHQAARHMMPDVPLSILQRSVFCRGVQGCTQPALWSQELRCVQLVWTMCLPGVNKRMLGARGHYLSTRTSVRRALSTRRIRYGGLGCLATEQRIIQLGCLFVAPLSSECKLSSEPTTCKICRGLGS
jgi:hypothetical protein